MSISVSKPQIYVISGKAGSGKDKAASIIKDIYSNKKCITVSYAYYLKDYLKRMGLYTSDDVKPRKLMQDYGLYLKEKMGANFLIKRTLEDIKIFEEYYDVIIITDARLKGEITEVLKLYPNAITIRIIRPNFDNKLSDIEKNDITECDLDNYEGFNYVILNDENFEDSLRRCFK